ncbi:MAG: hypothetical protein MUE52_03205 [Tabrizicola sp.]|jgi:hypothetical protein|nr:hypothetical protein [Tabrizicola sp.]
MSRAKDILRLQDLAALVRDHQLAQLRDAAARCEQSKMQISALEREPADVGTDLVAAGLIELRYQAWADVRRSELNAVLARQTADWLAAREEARTAFGRSEALRAVASRQVSRK